MTKVSIKQIEDALGLNMHINNIKNSNFEGRWSFCESANDCFLNADAAVLITEWQEFKDLDFELISRKMRKPAWIFDTRGIINIIKAKSHDLNVWSVGNGTINNENLKKDLKYSAKF